MLSFKHRVHVCSVLSFVRQKVTISSGKKTIQKFVEQVIRQANSSQELDLEARLQTCKTSCHMEVPLEKNKHLCFVELILTIARLGEGDRLHLD